MRVFRGRRDRPHLLEPVPDDLPRTGLFVEPIVVASLTVRPEEHLDDGRIRVTFRATVKDAEGKRCPDLAVEGRVVGPEREAAGMATTNLMGQVIFRMTGPPGTYRFTVDDVAAGGLELDRDASVLRAEVTVEPHLP